MKKKASKQASKKTGKKTEHKELEVMHAELHDLREESKQQKEKQLRILAEFENFKKRTSKEVQERGKYANDSLLGDLLPVLDDLDRVLDHVDPNASAEVKKLAEGVTLMQKNLCVMLAKFGLHEVKAQSEQFNPEQHEAISAVESEQDPDTVLAVHRKGYWLYERLLRPAMVTVAKK